MGKTVKIFYFVTIVFFVYLLVSHAMHLGEDGLPLCIAWLLSKSGYTGYRELEVDEIESGSQILLIGIFYDKSCMHAWQNFSPHVKLHAYLLGTVDII